MMKMFELRLIGASLPARNLFKDFFINLRFSSKDYKSNGIQTRLICSQSVFSVTHLSSICFEKLWRWSIWKFKNLNSSSCRFLSATFLSLDLILAASMRVVIS